MYKHRVGVNRFRFLLESMADLSSSIRKVQPLSTLLVVRGDPAELIPELVKRWSITHVVFESDPTGYAARRDKQVRESVEKEGVEVVEENGHWLYDPREVVKKNGGKPLTSMSQMQKVRGGGCPLGHVLMRLFTGGLTAPGTTCAIRCAHVSTAANAQRR